MDPLADDVRLTELGVLKLIEAANMTSSGNPDGSAQAKGLPAYFNMQARIGHTKHVGGWRSTQEIAEMMTLEPGQELLYVGSGSGVAAIKIAQTYGCHVVGVDLLEEMVAAARQWSAQMDAGGLVEFHVADARELPFESNRFDALLCESVNTFIPEPERVVRGYARVVKAGGFVGLNEPVWYEDPPESGAELMQELTGQHLRQPAEWIALLEEAGFKDIYSRTYPVEMTEEVRSQLGFLSMTEYLRILWRVAKSMLVDRDTRDLMRLAVREPRSVIKYMGYGLYVGRAPG